jgi:pilus assembly protein Flp/PilA
MSPARSTTRTAATPQHRTDNRCMNHLEDLMSQLVAFVTKIARNEEGQDLLEYALLVALIALVAIAAVAAAGTSVSAIFQNIANALSA